MSYRIETSCARTGDYQHTEVVGSKADVVEHCTADWRRESVHVVYALQAGIPPHMFAVYVADLTCHCKAYQHGRKPCWHRAAARLLLRYFESSGAGEHARHQRN